MRVSGIRAVGSRLKPKVLGFRVGVSSLGSRFPDVQGRWRREKKGE